VTRLPTWISWVTGRSSACIISRGAMLKKFTPRSGSKVSTADTASSALPSRTTSPTLASSDAISRSSSQTVPGSGVPRASASGTFSAGAVRRLPRKG